MLAPFAHAHGSKVLHALRPGLSNTTAPKFGSKFALLKGRTYTVSVTARNVIHLIRDLWQYNQTGYKPGEDSVLYQPA